MNTFQLSCFLAVANTLSFARAAQKMNISQPAITHQIKSLENELEVKLFNRSTRLVELTTEGQAFVSDAQSMVAIATQAKLRFSHSDSRPVEKLTIGCSSYNQLILLSDSLHELAKIYKNLHPQLIVIPHDQLYQQLETGAVDVIFDILDDQERTKRFSFCELQKSPNVCVCRSDHPLADKKTISLQELKEQPLIFCDPINLVPEVGKIQWQFVEGRLPVDLHFCASVEASVVMAGSGFGLAILPELLVPKDPQLSVITLQDAPVLTFGMFYKPYPGDDLLRKFIQITRRYFSDGEQS